MDETSLRAHLELAVSAEPPLGHLVGNSLRAGRRLRRRRAIGAASLSATAVALVSVVPVLTAGAGHQASRPHPAEGEQPAPMLYVATGDGTVVPVEVRTDKALAPINLHLPSTGIACMAVTRDGKTIWVAGFDGEITPISTATRTAGRPIVIDGHPDQIVLEPDGRSGYVVGDGGGFIPVNFVAETSGRLVRDHAIERLVLAPRGKTAYGLSLGPTTSVMPVNLTTDKPLRPITFRRLVLQFTLTPNGKSAWVYLGGTANTNELVEVNLTTRAIGAPINLPDGVQQVSFGPRDATAYAFGGGQVTPIDLARRALGTSIRVPAGPKTSPGGFALSPDGRTGIAFNLAPSRGVEITAIDFAKGTALSPVYLGYRDWQPTQVTFVPDSSMAYLTIVADSSRGRWSSKLIPVSATTGQRAGQPIKLGGLPQQILFTR
jgi:hypothetical protein